MSVLCQAGWSYVSYPESILLRPFLAHSRRLKPLDVEIMKRLGSRVNLIPVIAKADTITPEDLQNFKIKVSSAMFWSLYD